MENGNARKNGVDFLKCDISVSLFLARFLMYVMLNNKEEMSVFCREVLKGIIISNQPCLCCITNFSFLCNKIVIVSKYPLFRDQSYFLIMHVISRSL